MSDEKQHRPRSGPMDVALWLGAMIALYGNVISLLGLLTAYVDYLFPDPAYDSYGSYVDPYSGAARGAIAFLIVGVPVYLTLTAFLNRDLRAHPEKEALGFRRWVIIGSMFIAAVVILARLVGILNDFLGGELQVRSILKFLLTVVVLGGGIAYYLEDLRGRWRRTKARPVAIVAGAVVLVAVLGGFFVIGSPAELRAYRLDEQRVNDLTNLQYQVVGYYQQKAVLPASVDAITAWNRGWRPPTDPETQDAYTYRVVGDLAFEVCATFSKATPERNGRAVGSGADAFDNWVHPAGEHCFARTINPETFPPNPQG